jgi:hypothetical protein
MQMPQVQVRHRVAFGARQFHRGRDRAVGAAPTHQQQIAPRIAVHPRGGMSRAIPSILRARSSTILAMVVRIVSDHAAPVLFLEPADAMFQSGGAGNGPWSRQGLRIAPVGREVRGSCRGRGDGRSGKSFGFGSAMASALLARKLSESTSTGVMYFVASRTASKATGKQSAGDAAASTASGDSPCRP